MSQKQHPSYEELAKRLKAAEDELQALRKGEVDALDGEHGALLVRPASEVARMEHIRQMLLAIRNINQLIVEEEDPHRLVEGACQQLNEAAGYARAWIALMGPDDKSVLKTASSGMNGSFAQLEAILKEERIPRCMELALQDQETVVLERSGEECANCPLFEEDDFHTALSRSLRQNGRIYGVLTVALREGFAKDDQVVALFDEVAGDLGFALHKIELAAQREETEKELRLANRIINSSPAVAFLWRNEEGWPVEYVSENCHQLFGYEVEDFLLGRISYAQVVHPDDLGRVLHEVESAKREGEKHAFVHRPYRIIDAEGQVRWLDDRTTVLRDEKGRITHFQGVVLDISDRKRAEEAYHKSADLLSKAEALSAAGAWELELSTRTSTISANLQRMVGLDSATVDWETFRSLLPPEELPRVMETFERALDGEDEYDLEHGLLNQEDGKRIVVHSVGEVVRDRHGRPLRVYGVLRDITQQKALFDHLSEREELHRTTLSAIGDGVVVTDRQGAVINMNAVAEELTGWSLASAAREQLATVFNIVNAHSRKTVENPVNRVLETGKIVGLANHTVLIARDGTERQIADSAAPVVDDAGQTTGVVLVFRDVTQEYEAAEALRTSEEKFAKAFRTAPYAITITRAHDGKFIDVNDAFYRISGWTREEALEDSSIGLQLWRYEEERNELIADVSAGKTVHGREYHFRGKDGREIIGLFSAQAVEIGGELCVLSSINDITEQKKNLEELDRRRWRLDVAADAAGFGVGELDLRTGELIWDDWMYRLYGLDPEEHPDAQEAWEKGVHPEDRDRVYEEAQAGIRGEKPYDTEFRIVRPNGEIRIVKGKSTTIHDESGEPFKVIGINYDITEQKQTEGELEEKQYRMEMAADAAEFGIWELNLQTNELIWDDWMLRLYGVETEKFSGAYEAWEQGLHPDDKARAAEEVQTAIRQEQDFDTQFRVVRPDGEVRHIKANARIVKDAQGKPARMIGINYDITDRVLAEAQMRLQSLVLEQIQDLVTVTDLTGRIQYVNDAELKMLGYSREELLGASIDKYGEDPQQGASQAEILETTREKGTWRGEVVNQTKEGEEVILDVRTQLVRNSQGEPVAICGISTDITERKRAEAERERLSNQLSQAQKMESIGRLAGGVAHDFNNMLNVILGHTDMVLEDLPEEHDLQADLESIRGAAERSADLTSQLLAFARRQTVELKVLDLNETVASLIKMLRRLIGEDIDLLWNPAESLQPVRMDPAQLDQVLANLVVNARDAIGRENVGKITIETSCANFDNAYVQDHPGFKEGEYVMLGVSDDGCGMDDETRQQVFEPFFTTKSTGEGTGLGLATVYGIVRQNDGFINVYSEPGEGTTFRIYIPVYDSDSAEVSHVRQRDEVIAGQGETLLLVEDEPAILKLGVKMLERLGYKVIAASSPGEALELAKQHEGSIDLLITDVVMPEMHGRDLADKLLAYYPDIKRLFMSGYTANVIAHHGVLEEGIQFMQKPFSLTTLSVRVREVLENG